MATKADTWMPLYIADYLRKTMHLTRDQHGAYLLLIMACWDRGGRLPNDSGQLAGIARATPAEWKRLAPVLLPFFEIDGDHLCQGRVIAEHEKAARLSGARREAGRQGGRPRKQSESEQKPNGFANGKQTGLQTETPARVRSLPSPLPSEESPLPPDGGANRPITVRKADVDAIWSDAPRPARERSSRSDVERSLKAAAGRGRAPDAVRRGLAAYWASDQASKDGGAFVKGVHRMIEGDRWEGFVEEPEAGSMLEPPIEDHWAKRFREYRRNGYWNRLEWGAPPDKPGCTLPPELLMAHGFMPTSSAPTTDDERAVA